MRLVGRAVMVSHEGLAGREGRRHPVCGRGLWVSGCLDAEGEGGGGGTGVMGEGEEVLETDAVSMFEILEG